MANKKCDSYVLHARRKIIALRSLMSSTPLPRKQISIYFLLYLVMPDIHYRKVHSAPINKVCQPTAGFKHWCKQTTSALTPRNKTFESIFQTPYSPLNLNCTGRRSPIKCVNNWIRSLDTHVCPYVAICTSSPPCIRGLREDIPAQHPYYHSASDFANFYTTPYFEDIGHCEKILQIQHQRI
jgi:hypothetical protein